MKLFHFYRAEDLTGVSGTGPVVEGVQFSNGWCALRWMTETSSMCLYQSLEEVKKIHGHEGRTEIVVHDFEPRGSQKRSRTLGGRKYEILMDIIEEAASIAARSEDHATPEAEYLDAIAAIRSLIDTLEKQFHLTKSA